MHIKTNILSSFSMIVVLVFASILLLGQMTCRYPIELKWQGVTSECFAEDTLYYIGLESGDYVGCMPMFIQSYRIYDDQVKAKVELEHVKSLPLSDEELQVAHSVSLPSDFEVEAFPMRSRDESLLSVRINPVRQRGGVYEKLLSATLSVTLTPDCSVQRPNQVYATRSAMASGDWYKIGLSETGVYKLTYNELSDLGIDVAHVDPRHV